MTLSLAQWQNFWYKVGHTAPSHQKDTNIAPGQNKKRELLMLDAKLDLICVILLFEPRTNFKAHGSVARLAP